MGLCSDACVDFELVGNPTAGCDIGTFRKRTPSRLAFMKCNIQLPSAPYTALNMEPLLLGDPEADPAVLPQIVFSSPLRDFVINDPETTEVVIHDCIPPAKIVTKRTFTFTDMIPITENTNAFFDYDFWKDKKEHRLLLRYGIVYCNGDFVFCRDADDNLMEAWFDIIVSYEKIGNNIVGSFEIKKGTLEFAGDPLDFVKPDFNLGDLGIEV